jgi:hypothetical protein
MKKLSLTLVFSLGLIGTVLTACFCKDPDFPYFKMGNGMANVLQYSDSVSWGVGVDSTVDTITTDSAIVHLSIEKVYVASRNSFYFGNVARAFQCPADGHLGLKYPLERLEITSDQPYLNHEAGEDLSEFFFLNDQPVNEVVYDIIQYNAQDEITATGYDELYLMIPNRPQEQEKRVFNFIWHFENGTTSITSSKPVVW